MIFLNNDLCMLHPTWYYDEIGRISEHVASMSFSNRQEYLLSEIKKLAYDDLAWTTGSVERIVDRFPSSNEKPLIRFLAGLREYHIMRGTE